MILTEPKLCVGLDTADVDRARTLATELAGVVDVFKVGLELFCSGGPGVVAEILEHGPVFLDLKVNDIPRQSAGAVAAAGRMGARYVTVHTNAGRSTLRAAQERAAELDVTLLAVSVLTSLDARGLAELGVARSVGEQVLAAADLATSEGIGGLVLSAHEVRAIKERHPELVCVTPGIRPTGSAAGDQRRFDTPGAAVAAGTDIIVVARPVVEAPQPREAALRILGEMGRAGFTGTRSR